MVHDLCAAEFLAQVPLRETAGKVATFAELERDDSPAKAIGFCWIRRMGADDTQHFGPGQRCVCICHGTAVANRGHR